ncbi:MAG: tetratricopeptide repeat protein [Hyphomicrobiaceae bacterium]
MITDAQANALSGATEPAARHLDAGVRAFAMSYGDVMGALDQARTAAPAMTMAHLAKAWVLVLSNDAILAAKAPPLMAEAAALTMNERERAHAAALAHAAQGHRAAAIAVLDRHLMSHPHDVLAHMCCHYIDAFHGRFHRSRDRSARALPRWSPDMPGYGLLLAFYGFGLEEAGDYARAEDVSRQAAELEPLNYWPHHGVSHVMEMSGRPADGLRWMADREPLWSGEQNTSRTHIWWHKALFHMELGQYPEMLAIYDGPIVETQRPLGISLTNATALLWRLEMLGVATGDRWQALADLWQSHTDGRLCVFADIHAAMTALRADRGAEVDRIVTAMRATAAGGTEAAPVFSLAGLPLVEGLAAYNRGAYADALEHLFKARDHLWMIGGSHAQRDLLEWTLAEAAVRAGQRDVAIALANERLGLRPDSAPNKRLLETAQAIAA